MPISAAHRDVKFGHFELQPAARRLLVQGQPARLGARAFDVLMALVERRERIVGKNELLDLVWPGLVVEENNLQVHISALRKVCGPPVISTIPGRGYRFTALLDADVTSSNTTSNTTDEPAQIPHNLPHQRSHFIGREAALAQCARLMPQLQLLTFTGIGGCGKTRLALQLASDLKDAQPARFADGVWFIDLAPLQEPERVALAVAAVLGVREEAGTPLIDRVADRLATQHALLVLDNCEHLIDAVAHIADALLAACPAISILATSRERLGLGGEQVFAVPPLSLPSGTGGEAMQGSEAVRLFVARAGLALPEFAVDAHNAAAIEEICRRLDGVALAIELAAARVGMLSVAEIAARLNDRFRFLTAPGRTLARHQTLQATLQWSFDTLSQEQRQLFRELAVFQGGCTLAAAVSISGSTEAHAVLELLSHLHDKSLLVVDREGAAEPRYRLLETVRQYALERLAEAGDGDAVRDRHLQHFVALAEAAGQQMNGLQQAEAMARLHVEQENLMAAQAWCEHAAGGSEFGLRLVASLWRYWVASAQLERGHRLTQTALNQAARHPNSASSAWRCRALWAMGQTAFRMGRYDETLQHGDACLALARGMQAEATGPPGDADRIVGPGTEHIATGLIMRAGAFLATGRLPLAQAEFEHAREVSRSLGSNFALIAALHGLAEVNRARGQLDGAEACYEESVAVARALQDARATALPLCNLAGLLVASGKLDRVRPMLLESLALATSAGLKGVGEHLLEVSAGLAVTVGDHRNAAYFSGAALACMHEAGSQREPLHEAFVAPLIARARAALGNATFNAAKAEGQALDYAAAMREVEQWLNGEVGSAAQIGAPPAKSAKGQLRRVL